MRKKTNRTRKTGKRIATVAFLGGLLITPIFSTNLLAESTADTEMILQEPLEEYPDDTDFMISNSEYTGSQYTDTEQSNSECTDSVDSYELEEAEFIDESIDILSSDTDETEAMLSEDTNPDRLSPEDNDKEESLIFIEQMEEVEEEQFDTSYTNIPESPLLLDAQNSMNSADLRDQSMGTLEKKWYQCDVNFRSCDCTDLCGCRKNCGKSLLSM